MLCGSPLGFRETSTDKLQLSKIGSQTAILGL